MKLSHLFAVAALPLALTACNPDPKNPGGNTDPDKDQNVKSAKAALLDLQGLMPLDSVETKTAQFRATNRALEDLLTDDVANLDSALDVTLLALQQALTGFVTKNDDDPEAITYQFAAAETEVSAKIGNSTLFGNSQVAGSFKLVETTEDVTDPETQEVTTVTKHHIVADNLTVTDIVSGNVVTTDMRLALPDVAQLELTFGIEQFEFSSTDTLRKLFLEGENATLSAPLNAAQVDTPVLTFNATFSAEQYETDFADENLTATLASGELNYSADLVNDILKRTQLSLNGSIGAESALFSLDYQATVASELKAQLLNATGYRVGDDASEWVSVKDKRISTDTDAVLEVSFDDVSISDSAFFLDGTGETPDFRMQRITWYDGELNSFIYHDSLSVLFEDMLVSLNEGPVIEVYGVGYDVSGIGNLLLTENEVFIEGPEGDGLSLVIRWNANMERFELLRFENVTNRFTPFANYYFNTTSDQVAKSTFTQSTEGEIESEKVSLEFDYHYAADRNASLTKYHSFSGKSYKQISLDDLPYTSLIDFEFDIAFKNENLDNLQSVEDSEKITSVSFYTGACDFDMACSPVEFNFDELGVAKFQLEQDGVTFDAEEIEGGLFYTLRKDDKNVVITQNSDDALDILFGKLAIQLNLGEATTGDVLYNNANVGSVTEVDGQLTVTFNE
ncbi:hypothetical protein [Reinekea sp. G2M2-21]|uniref:hypothetical protein n=1 Tax=Reinekea sp. G2M2-21 TaxID=2788942 RepID=UPI0018A8D19E|nr:hypothetical protein [Reinekea sp. G2M2-21]